MVMECNLSHHNQLPAMSMRDIILGFDQSIFGYHNQKQSISKHF